MARTARIWFRKATGWYMTTHRGQQIKLSKDKAEATKAFHTLMASAADEPTEEKTGVRPAFRKIADLFPLRGEADQGAWHLRGSEVLPPVVLRSHREAAGG